VIDFGEDADDLGGDVLAAVGPRVARLAAEIGAALAVGRRGELLRDGPRVVIVGAPNAGKVGSPSPVGWFRVASAWQAGCSKWR
jgi:tRNA U34 5-carboxymethylaminomethyl modifying GTPase MnmE/TrmE